MMKGGNSTGINNSSNTNSNSSGSKYVSELRASDVLFGRGSGPNDHIGNIRFRQYVAERKAQYMSTNHRLTKTKIAREIVNLVWQEHGRFVKKVEPQELQQLGLPENTEYYELVDDETIMEKAKQALRQNQNSASATAATATGAATTGVTSSSIISQGGSSSNHSSIATNPFVDVSSSLSSSNSTSQPTQHPSVVTSSGTTSTNTTTAMMSSEDISYHSYDLEPLPLMTTSESQIPMENINHNNNIIGSRRNSSNHHNNSDIHHSTTNPMARDVMGVPEDWTNTAIHGGGGGGFHEGYGNVTTTAAAATSTTAIPHPNNMMHTKYNSNNNYIQTNNQDYQHVHQQRQRLQQLQEQQRLLHHQQQQLQLQMAAIMDDTTPIPLHHPQQQQRTMLSLEQHALLRSRLQQQHEQEQQLAAAIRSLDVYPIIQNTSTTTNTTANMTNTNSNAIGTSGTRNNNNHVLDDHSHFNSSMAQLPHEEVSYSTKRHSIRIEDLEHVRASVASAMSGRGGCVDDIDDEDEDESLRPVGKNINMAANNQHIPSMNSINNFSMSLQQIQRGSVDELMGSFHQMKTPSMEVNLENSVYLSSFAANDPNSSHNRNKNSSSMLTQEQHRSKMMASTETMGTIEPIGSTADMSILMGSSTFSLFRHGNESSAIMEESGTTGTTTSTSGATAGSLMQRGGGSSQLPLHRQNSINQSQLMSSLLTQPSMASKSSSKTSSSIESNNSFHLSEIFGKSSTNVVNNNSMSMAYVMSDVRRQIDEEDTNDLDIHDSSNYIYDESGVVATLPRTIGVMLELPDETNSTSNQNSCTDNLDMMGSSSLAVLQSALLHSTNTEIQGDDDDDDEVNHRHRRNEHDTTTTTKSP